jgi:hypothetical protein
MMRPVDEISGGGVRPLMTTQTTQPFVVPFIEQVKEVKNAVMGKGHTVAQKEIASRLEVLHQLILNLLRASP